MKRVLVADDDKMLRTILGDIFVKEGYDVVCAADGEEAVQLFSSQPFDAVVMDVRMPNMDGVAAHAAMRRADPTVPVILITAFAALSDAVNCIKEGAYYYFQKPVDYDLLLLTVKRAIEGREMKIFISAAARTMTTALRNRFGVSPEMEAVLSQVTAVSNKNVTILISGETGTGKTVLARAAHEISGRAEGPFVQVDINGIPETLLESELFGHDKGAFTGADRVKKGYFEAADGGILFIDEVQNIPYNLQGKILRAIDEKVISKVGSVSAMKVDIMVIATSNTDLRQEVRDRRFREDLYFRLAEVPIHIPPLRERREDIRFFAEKFSQDIGLEFGSDKTLSDEAVSLLLQYDWPGNIRELKHIIKRAMLFVDGDVITEKHLASVMRSYSWQSGDDDLTLENSLRNFERDKIQAAIAASNGNKTRAARRIGISYRTMMRKLSH